MVYYNRYSKYEGNGKIGFIPYLPINQKSTDKSVLFEKGKTQLNIVSNTYYGSPYFEWLLRYANVSLGADEFEWPDNSIIVIPYPLLDTINELQTKIEQYQNRY
jgi:hypothetical protein